MSRKTLTNPVTAATLQHDPLQIYRSRLFRTMAGYKLLSGTMVVCGTLAVPTLIYSGQEAGPMGPIAIAIASLLPWTLQTILVPRYVASISLVQDEKSTPTKRKTSSKTPFDLSRNITPQTTLNIQYFTFFGYLTSKVEALSNIRYCRGYRWVNWKTLDGKGFYVDPQAASPVLRKIMELIEQPPPSN